GAAGGFPADAGYHDGGRLVGEDGRRAGAGHAGVADLIRPAELFSAGGEVQGVQLLHVVDAPVAPAHFLSLDHLVERAGGGVDLPRAGDADFREKVWGREFRVGGRGDAVGRVDVAVVPELGAGVRVEGVDAVMLRGDEGNVVRDA